ncbi:MAG: Smr/MutS family protein [Deltaproteobacteria bacterium]|nr:Smr/MutS family protein [Deltaproteobacteria bacterium]
MAEPNTPLHLDRVLRALQGLCQSDLGARRAATLPVADDRAHAERLLDEVGQAEILLHGSAILGIPGQLDIEPLLDQAAVGASLGAAELAGIGKVARQASELRRAAPGWPATAAGLAERARAVPDVKMLADWMAESVDGEGRILDGASPELARLRQETVTIAARLRRRIEALVRETDAAGLLQDDYFTLRDDRYVLPVRQSEKRTLAGIIHGSSQTGHTVYVEPQELVEANNQLALAFDAVRREERRILAELSAMCADNRLELLHCVEVLVAIDLRLAAARLARQLHAHRPTFDDDRLELPALRHPVLELDGARPVANRLAMTQPATRWWVVSGPNGGGKTVMLTALGLCVEMARRGLYITATADATLPWFDAVWAVVGDAQDLERGLSTFEGHLRLVADTLRRCEETPRSLALFDELAAGTEPLAANALATAILERAAAISPKTWGAATTHFEACKLLALRNPAFVNAALGRDPASGTPTYVLALGQIGTSDPLGLARRVGLDPGLVDRASALMGSAGSELESMLHALQQQHAAVEEDRAQLRHKQAQLDHARALLDDQRHNERRAADRRVERAAQDLMAQLHDLARDVESARQKLADADRAQVLALAKAASQGLSRAQDIVAQARGTASTQDMRKPLEKQELRAGAAAYHKGLGKPVVVVEWPGRGERVRVAAGGLELWAELGELLAALPGESPKQARPSQLERKPRRDPADASVPRDDLAAPQSLQEAALILRTADATVDLRGMRVDEALLAVDRHLDQCVLRGGVGACVVHGQGTGALKGAVRDHLGRHPQVAEFRAGERHEGGDGATLVWLVR